MPLLSVTCYFCKSGQDPRSPETLKELRFLDYRYLRFIFHPGQDKFVMNNDWWDNQWTDVKAMRQGLDSEERDPRDQVFGKNVIQIRQKTIPELLVDEVCSLLRHYGPY